MGPDRAVGEPHLLDPLMAVVDRVVESDAVGAAGDTQDEVAAAIGLGDGDVGGQDSRAKLEHVGTAVTAAAVAPFGDDVLAIAGVEHKGVVAAIARQRVVAKAAGQRVVAGPAIEQTGRRRVGKEWVSTCRFRWSTYN